MMKLYKDIPSSAHHVVLGRSQVLSRYHIPCTVLLQRGFNQVLQYPYDLGESKCSDMMHYDCTLGKLLQKRKMHKYKQRCWWWEMRLRERKRQPPSWRTSSLIDAQTMPTLERLTTFAVVMSAGNPANCKQSAKPLSHARDTPRVGISVSGLPHAHTGTSGLALLSRMRFAASKAWWKKKKEIIARSVVAYKSSHTCRALDTAETSDTDVPVPHGAIHENYKLRGFNAYVKVMKNVHIQHEWNAVK
jgi:hypothetical protein